MLVVYLERKNSACAPLLLFQRAAHLPTPWCPDVANIPALWWRLRNIRTDLLPWPLSISEIPHVWGVCCFLGVEGRLVPWFLWRVCHSWQGHRNMSLQRGGLSLHFQQSCLQPKFRKVNNNSCPWLNGLNKGMNKSTAHCLLSSGGHILW